MGRCWSKGVRRALQTPRSRQAGDLSLLRPCLPHSGPGPLALISRLPPAYLHLFLEVGPVLTEGFSSRLMNRHFAAAGQASIPGLNACVQTCLMPSSPQVSLCPIFSGTRALGPVSWTGPCPLIPRGLSPPEAHCLSRAPLPD